MENNTSKRIKYLIIVILLLFLIPSAFEFVSGFRRGFSKEFEKGMSVGKREATYKEQMLLFFTGIESVDPEVRTFGNGAEFISTRTFGELYLPANAGTGAGRVWIEVATMVLSLVVLAAIIVFLVQLIRFTIFFLRRRIMDPGNIKSLRKIALWLGVIGLATYVIDLMQFFWLRSLLTIEGYRVVIDSQPSALIVALILVVMTEILKLAGRLQNEQDLTI